MRIVFNPASYPPVLGGLQTVAHRLACHARERGHKVTVITKKHPWHLPARETIDAIPVQRFVYHPATSHRASPWRLDRLLRARLVNRKGGQRLLEAILSFRPDVLNVHFPHLQVPSLLELRDVPVVISFHGNDIRMIGDHRLRPAEARARDPLHFDRLAALIARAAAVTACSQYVLDEVNRLFPAAIPKGYVVHNGINPARFQTIRANQALHPRPFLFAFGRLTAKKGFAELIEAVESNWAPDLLIAGSGPEKDNLASLVHQRNLAGKVHLLGRLEADTLVEYLQQAEVTVLPSLDEPFGIAVVEALAVPRRVVSSNVGGIPEIFAALPDSLRGARAGCWLTEPTPAQLRETLASALEDKPSPDFLTERARFAQDHFAWEPRLDQYLNVMENALQRT